MSGRLRGHRVKARREALGMSQDELAALLQTDKRQVVRWEKEQTDPSSSTVVALIVALQTTSAYLFGEDDNPAPHYREEDLTAQERELILAIRERQTRKAVRILANLSDDIE